MGEPAESTDHAEQPATPDAAHSPSSSNHNTTSPETAAPAPHRKRPPRTIFTRIEQLAAAVLAMVVLGLSVRYLADLPRGPFKVQHNAIDRPPVYHLIVDVNTAGWRRMALVPGIGEKRARQIIAEREANGPYEQLDDLATRIRGIGPATVARLREWMVARPVANPQTQTQPQTHAQTLPANH